MSFDTVQSLRQLKRNKGPSKAHTKLSYVHYGSPSATLVRASKELSGSWHLPSGLLQSHVGADVLRSSHFRPRSRTVTEREAIHEFQGSRCAPFTKLLGTPALKALAPRPDALVPALYYAFPNVTEEPESGGVAARRSDRKLYGAAELLRQASVAPDPSLTARVVIALRRAISEEAEIRPRHAAVALALWDALRATAQPFATRQRRKVLWDASAMLLAQFISTEDELALLARMDATGLERIPPFEDSLVGRFLSEAHGEDLR